MALVAYSDSEGSDSEPPPAPKPKSIGAGTFKKVEPRKIKVDLPSAKGETAEQEHEDRPAKRAKTAGAFSGFNSLLPAPKRTAAQSAPARGVSLKTSSEAAFSRQPVSEDVAWDNLEDSGTTNGASNSKETAEQTASAEEPKIVGKATKFKPLSVQSGKKNKTKPIIPPVPTTDEKGSVGDTQARSMTEDASILNTTPQPVKAKRSLFSVPQADTDESPAQENANGYVSITTPLQQQNDLSNTNTSRPTAASQPVNSDSLQSLASDLNLTPAQRRQLFGRKAKDGDINIAHFDMDAEYASNEQLRQAGEVVEHKAVKSIAPGKHSLQQLVNNARSQQENLEDKWAEGRMNRGEGGSKYGWGR
jgi:hypothetical protein